MKTDPHQPYRILAISLSSRGFGYAVMERDNALVDYGHKVFSGDKNARALWHIERMIARNLPDALVLQDVNVKGARRAPRIKDLHRQVVALAKGRKLKVVVIAKGKVRAALLGDAAGTGHEAAESLAKRFPDELASRLPPKRKPWKSEDARMDIFEAVALAVAVKCRILIVKKCRFLPN